MAQFGIEGGLGDKATSLFPSVGDQLEVSVLFHERCQRSPLDPGTLGDVSEGQSVAVTGRQRLSKFPEPLRKKAMTPIAIEVWGTDDIGHQGLVGMDNLGWILAPQAFLKVGENGRFSGSTMVKDVVDNGENEVMVRELVAVACIGSR